MYHTSNRRLKHQCPPNGHWHLPGRFGCFSFQQLSCNKRRTSCSAALYSASLPLIGRLAMCDNWTCEHHTSPHSHPTLGDHYIIGCLNSLKPQGVLIIMNLSHLIKQSKPNKNSDTMRLPAVTACHCYLWPQFLPPTSPPYHSLTTFQHQNQFCTLRCLHQVLEDGCVQPVSTDGIMEKG